MTTPLNVKTYCDLHTFSARRAMLTMRVATDPDKIIVSRLFAMFSLRCAALDYEGAIAAMKNIRAHFAVHRASAIETSDTLELDELKEVYKTWLSRSADHLNAILLFQTLETRNPSGERNVSEFKVADNP